MENAIVDDPPITLKDGGVIRDGFHEELDRQRRIMNGGTQIVDEILQRERERTGIKGLKIGYNRVFGYYLEVTRSYYDLIPADYIRKQTLANSERFITEELKQVENEILGAKDRVLRLEEGIFTEVRDCLAAMLQSVQETATAVAQVDVLASFANIALENDYTKPEIAVDGAIQITNGRHPVVERMLTDEVFVHNDAYLDLKSTRMRMITGPNMAGKSTYMRQVALITLMAQIGSFVPAEYARISVVDKIFTRIGASDDLTAGQSTFMVEMKEVSDILNYATQNSLVILDEVGRGTSTLDGVSIARAVAEYISSRKIGCKTLFATHYHELLDMEQKTDGVKNYSVAVKKHGDSIRFLRKIVPGGVDDSYGIAVAKLAGLPDQVVKAEKCYLSLAKQLLDKENHKFQYKEIEHGGRAQKYYSSVEWLLRADMVQLCKRVTDVRFDLDDYARDDFFRAYTTDLSLLMAMKDFSLKQHIVENTLAGNSKGGIYECAIADALYKKGYQIYFYKNDTTKREIDVIIQKDGSVVPIEVKSGNTRANSLKWLMKNNKDISYGYKFADGNIGVSEEGIITLPLYMIAFI